MEQYYRVQQAAELADVEEETVLWWIEQKELAAVNVAKNPNGKRPRWRIPESELGAFLLRRRTQKATPDPRPSRAPKRAVTEFYK